MSVLCKEYRNTTDLFAEIGVIPLTIAARVKITVTSYGTFVLTAIY